MLDGVLVIDKPSGPTSHDVVARIRRALRLRRIGHTGTLDPMATGVLVLVLGRATRLARFFSATMKTYDATIRLGASTDTYDATGRVLHRDAATDVATPDSSSGHGPPVTVARQRLDKTIAAFSGTFWQTPPPYSAKRLAGERAYDLARRGRRVATKPVSVNVDRIEVLECADDRVRIRLTCSPGFYVRSLAHDIGAALGCGAHLEALRRERSGDFGLEVAVALDAVEREGPAAAARVRPLAALLPGLPGVVLTERGISRATHGNPVSGADLESVFEPDASVEGHDRPTGVRLLAPDGSLLAVAEPRLGGTLHPTVVLV